MATKFTDSYDVSGQNDFGLLFVLMMHKKELPKSLIMCDVTSGK
jgi:hypothetical protein